MEEKQHDETYLMLDIETTGHCSALHSMIEFAVVHLAIQPNVGVVNVDYFQAALKEFPDKREIDDTDTVDGWRWEEDTFRWWHYPSREPLLRDIEAEARDPYEVMREFAEWLKKFKNPVITCFGGDIEFIKLYWWRVFETIPPFGFHALDAKAYAMATLNCRFQDTMNMRLRRNHKELFRPDLPHTHRALDDAKEQAFVFLELRKRIVKGAIDRLINEGNQGPIPMILFCPHCGLQHIDKEEPENEWLNPPHKSHQCKGCNHRWRPCDRETVGVATINTKGSRDTQPAVEIMLPSAEASLLLRNEMRVALEESLKLQKHYGELLNMHDGGERITFSTVESWISRLKSVGKII